MEHPQRRAVSLRPGDLYRIPNTPAPGPHILAEIETHAYPGGAHLRLVNESGVDVVCAPYQVVEICEVAEHPDLDLDPQTLMAEHGCIAPPVTPIPDGALADVRAAARDLLDNAADRLHANRDALPDTAGHYSRWHALGAVHYLAVLLFRLRDGGTPQDIEQAARDRAAQRAADLAAKRTA